MEGTWKRWHIHAHSWTRAHTHTHAYMHAHAHTPQATGLFVLSQMSSPSRASTNSQCERKLHTTIQWCCSTNTDTTRTRSNDCSNTYLEDLTNIALVLTLRQLRRLQKNQVLIEIQNEMQQLNRCARNKSSGRLNKRTLTFHFVLSSCCVQARLPLVQNPRGGATMFWSDPPVVPYFRT